MSTTDRAIQWVSLHREAPLKPPLGSVCNGCGACCAVEPCPVSRFVLGHRSGSCPALQWHEADVRYRCRMVVEPASMLAWLPESCGRLAGELFHRWISAGSGCDFDATMET